LKRIVLLLLFLALAYALVFLWGVYSDPLRPDVRHRVFGNQKRLDEFLASQQVTAQRLHARPYDGISVGLDSYDKGPPVQVAPAQVQEIKELLQSPSSYPWGSVTACLPDYGVLLTFHNDQRTIQIAFCYQCNQLAIFEGNSAYNLNSVQDFDPIRTQLVAVAKAIFPTDPEIQALK
jgi:hypothetical protein